MNKMLMLGLGLGWSVAWGATPAQDCIPIYVVGEFSSVTASTVKKFGKESQRGVDLALGQLSNSQLCSQSVAIDIRSKIDEIGTVIQKGIKGEGALLIGLGTSDQVLAAEVALNKTHSLLITPTASSDQISEMKRVFSLFPSNSRIVDAAIAQIKPVPSSKVAAIYLSDNEYSRDIFETFKAQMQRKGASITAYPFKASKMNQADSIKDLIDEAFVKGPNAPDYIFLPLFELDAEKVLARLEELKFSGSVIGTDSWGSEPRLFANLKNKFTVKAYYPVIYSATLNFPVNKVFLEKYRTEYGEDPIDLSAFSYDAVFFYSAMLKKCSIAEMKKDPYFCLKKALPVETTTGFVREVDGGFVRRPIFLRLLKDIQAVK